MSEVSIYVCCHKDYEDVGINNPAYKLISDKDIKNNSPLDFVKSDGFLDNRMWSEMTQIYYIWKHPELQNDWIGLSHYRRYFEFMNDIPELTKPVVAKHILNPFNNYVQYDICHNSRDLMTTLNIIRAKKPEYYPAFITMMDNHRYLPYNMFILPKALFNEYCEFVFGILEEFDKAIGVNNDYINMIKHIGQQRERYVEKSGYPSNDFGYQARLFGFTAERLTTAFFFKYIHDNGSDSVEEIDVVVTEETYNQVKVKHLEDLKK